MVTSWRLHPYTGTFSFLYVALLINHPLRTGTNELYRNRGSELQLTVVARADEKLMSGCPSSIRTVLTGTARRFGMRKIPGTFPRRTAGAPWQFS
jgi:hypothetical protein